jgi:hypothetical protein
MTKIADSQRPSDPTRPAAAPPTEKDGAAKTAPVADAKGAPADNKATLSGKPGQSTLSLPGTTTTVTRKTTTTTTTTVTEETTTTTTAGKDPATAGKDAPPAGKDPAGKDTPPAANPREIGDNTPLIPAGEKVPGYQETFGNQSYVKDGGNKDMIALAQKVVDRNPALKDSPLAQHLKDGKMGPEDVKALQSELQSKGFDVGKTGVDGKYGPNTHAALQKLLAGEKPGASTPPTQQVPPTQQQPASPQADADLEGKLKSAAEHSQYNEGIHKCFKYAWDVNRQTGGKDINHATQSHDGRGQPITHLDQMVKDGKLKPGDVIYVNKKPGADPSSTNLAYGPHWFVYMGHGKFADQYHNRATGGREKSATEMQAFVRGRVIDTVYHTH